MAEEANVEFIPTVPEYALVGADAFLSGGGLWVTMLFRGLEAEDTALIFAFTMVSAGIAIAYVISYYLRVHRRRQIDGFGLRYRDGISFSALLLTVAVCVLNMALIPPPWWLETFNIASTSLVCVATAFGPVVQAQA